MDVLWNIFFYVAWNTLCRLSELTFGVLTHDLELWIAANQKSDQQDASNGAVDSCIVCTRISAHRDFGNLSPKIIDFYYKILDKVH